MKNWTEARALRATERRYATIERLLGEIGALWADCDEYLVRQADELRATIAAARADARDQVESARQERAWRAEDEREAEGGRP